MQTRFFSYGIFLSLGGLIVALISQHVFEMRPCAWCVFQRLLLLFVLAFCIFGQLLSSLKLRFLSLLFGALGFLTALGGMAAAWYQYTVAAKLFSCDMTFADRVMTQSGLEASLPWLFGIYASCMDATVHVLGLEYAIWALLLFALIAVCLLLGLLRRR